jgi:Tol biopolymer transport system component
MKELAMKKTALFFTLAALASGPARAQYDTGYTVFGQNKIAYDHFAWETYKSTHFTIYFYKKEEVTLSKVASYAESAYDDISRALNYQIPKSINLIYYADHSDFEQTNTLLNFIPEGVGAFALPTRNRMVLPVDLPDEKLQELIAHELTHVFQFEIFFGGNYLRAATTNAPQWLMEGMASYFGNDEDNKDRMVLRDAVLSDQVPQVTATGINGYFAYRFGHAVFDFMTAEWGRDAVRDFVFEFRTVIGPSIEKAIKRAFNISGEDFDIRFRRFLRQRYLKILVERGEPTDFGERFKVEDTPSAELSPRAYPSGDFIAAFSTYKEKADVVVASTRDRKLYRNLTKGYTTKYEYLISQWIETGPQQGADLAISPDGNLVAVFARRERGRDLLLLNALDGGIRETIVMPDLDQQLSPTFSPDGTTIAFRALKAARDDIWTYNLQTKQYTNLTNDDAFDFAPAYSPDGKWLYYSSVRGTKAKLFRLNPNDPQVREQITYGEWNDEDPTLSPDGKRLFFTSDRDGGIYNIYSVNIDTGETFLHTNVVAGAFCPTVFVGKGNAEKLVFAAYYKRQFTLYIADSQRPVRRLPELNPTVTPVEPAILPTYQPAIEVSVDPEKINKKVSRKLYLEDASVAAGVNTDQTFVSDTTLVFGDNLGNRRFIASLFSVSTYTDFRFTFYDMERRLQKGITAFDSRSYFYGTSIDPSTGSPTRGRLAQRYTGGFALGSYPLSRYYRLDGQLGFLSRQLPDYVVTNADRTQSYFSPARTDNFPQIGVTLTGDTTQYASFGPLAGTRFAISASYAPDFSSNPPVGPPGTTKSSTLNASLILDFRHYFKITRRMLFAVRLYGAASRGNAPDVYSFGGLDTLRGYLYGSIIGNTVGYANFELRVPLIDYLILPFLGIRDIRGRMFFDVGGGALKGQTFQFWTTSGNAPLLSGCRGTSGPCLVDGKASWGFGFELNFLGLPLHFDWAQLTDLQHPVPNPDNLKTGFQLSFYIGPSF